MSKKEPAPVRFDPRASSAIGFRTQIEAALAEGHTLDDLTLHLTLGDASKMKADPKVPLADINFAGGVMRYLGVKVEQGGVTVSALELPQ